MWAVNAYPEATWRLIRSAEADGATQMAVDEAVWQAVAEKRVPPTLRLYTWSPPCLSLGRNQPVGDVSQDALRTAGHDLVRRPTGGRAVLHVDELTYSVAVPLSDARVRGGVIASCQRLSQGLTEALATLGVRKVTARRRSAGSRGPGPICFETAADFEVLADGRKLIGSAQMRGRGCLLQHGALPLRGDVACVCFFLTSPADPAPLRARATTLAQVLGRQVSWEEAAEAVAVGFAQSLNLRLEPGGLTSEEQAAVRRLREEKYSTDRWTVRR